jgi:4-amino-4-deoxy-L-arabinose transferase-like glycosyltransferase
LLSQGVSEGGGAKRPRLPELVTSPIVLVGVIVLASVIIRLRGITWGLPYLYDPDEHFLVDPAVRFVTTGDLNPHWFAYPASTIMYTLGVAFLGYWLVGHVVGWFPDLHSFATLFWTDPTSFYLIARVVAIVLATLAIPLTYLLCRSMSGKGASLAAAIFVAVSPLHAEFSRVVRTDPLMTTFILAAMLYAVKAVEDPFSKTFFLSGIFIGLATATKFPGISGAMIVVLAIVLAKPEPRTQPLKRLQWLVVAFAGGLIGFFGAAPFVVTGVREVYWTLFTEATHGHLSATGSRGLSNYLWYVKGPLRDAIGWPLELAAVVGIVACWRGRRRPRLLLASFSILFLLGIGLSLKRWERWIVPLMPCVAMLAAIGIEEVVRTVGPWANRSTLREAAITGLGVLLVIPTMNAALERGGITSDTRNIGKTWVEGHVPRGAKVAVEQYTPPISRNEYEVYVVVRDNLERDSTTRGFKGILAEVKTIDALRGKEIDYILLSDFSDRFRAEIRSYPKEVEFYKALLEASEILYEISPSGRMKGPTIRVLRLRR